jgi:hypothetical protein
MASGGAGFRSPSGVSWTPFLPPFLRLLLACVMDSSARLLRRSPYIVYA